MNLDLDQALAVARNAALAAGEVIEHYYAHGVAVRIKADSTPVTQADEDSERVIREILLAAYPDHAIYGEEGGRSGSGDYLWLVDPIDGTKSFVRGYPFFSTQIALMYRGELLLGVSHASAFRETAWARRGGGAFLNGKPVRVGAIEQLAQATLSTGNLKTLAGDRRWQVLADLVRGAHRARGYGDFYHYHLLASGRIDLVLESDVNILDIAALVAIIREAGGVFTDLDGAEIGLDTTTVLAGTAGLHAQVLARMRAA
jgi:histidinol-phosphatase